MNVWNRPDRLILASASTTRRDMLEAVGLPLEVMLAAVDERAIDAPLRAQGAAPHTIALALATAKARALAQLYPDRVVLGADQILDCEGTIFDKAKDRAEAIRNLAHLANRTHRLTSAAVVMHKDDICVAEVSEAHLTMRPLHNDSLQHYAEAADHVLTRSVGGYEIEGLGAHLFSRIEGDHFTIRGLPLLQLLQAMRAKGWVSV